jgi:RHS repeat-associated protein
MGNLRHVSLPDGRAVDYVIDPSNRRIAKKVNGTVVKRWLYRDNLNPVAEFDGSGALVSRFNIGAVVKAGTTYRIVVDDLGSLRLVVNASTGAIVQRMEHDEWGQVTADTSTGFTPLGFAGGIYDPDTGLVRFGARDHDSTTGRWTAKDPVGLNGGDSNIYGYVLNDPVNGTDRRGLWGGGAIASGAIEGGALVGGMGANGSVAFGGFTGGGSASCPCGTHAAPQMTSFASGGAFTGSPVDGEGYPGGTSTGNGVLGLYAGGGAGLFATTADSASELSGPSDTWNINLGPISIQVNHSAAWTISATVGPSFGLSISRYPTNTATETVNCVSN